MAHVVSDRVWETSTTTGTGTYALAGAVTGLVTFSTGVGNGNTTFYCATDGTAWEIGVGTVAAGTLARTTILRSSNANAAVSWTAGSKDVFCTNPAARSPFLSADGNTLMTGTVDKLPLAGTAHFDQGTVPVMNYAGTGFSLGKVPGRNKLINSNFQVDQRGNSVGIPIGLATLVYPCDHWNVATSGAMNGTTGVASGITGVGAYTILRVSPTVTIASPAAGDAMWIAQNIEGWNCHDLELGIAALPMTLSFWVYTSIAGTYAGAFRNGDSASYRHYIFTYVVNSANAWEYKTITINGDSTGSWYKDNRVGLTLFFALGTGTGLQGTAGAWTAGNKISVAGAANLSATAGNHIYFARVQLERGSVATAYEYVDFPTDILRCMRYYEKSFRTHTADRMDDVNFLNLKRATPTIIITQGAGATISLSGGSYPGTTGFRVEPAGSGLGDFTWLADAEL